MDKIFKTMPSRSLIEKLMSKDNKIKIESPILRTRDDNYILFGKEHLPNDKCKHFACTLSECQYKELITYLKDIKVRREEA